MRDTESLPISALQHFLYCPRQCALIHVEKIWEENLFTAEGRLLHNRVDSGEAGRRGSIDEERSVPVRSERLGLYGVADVLEMRTGASGTSIPYPVEYKRGSPKVEDWDRVQLCAQAMCLEEMLELTIREGAIFYGRPRRREKVIFDDALREKVEGSCRAMHSLIEGGITPSPEQGPRCRNCSLLRVCMPKLSKQRKVEKYLLQGLEQ